jgi:uncharacterized membrane protein
MSNSIPLRHRIGYGLAAAILATLCLFSIYFGELPIPSSRSRGVSTMSGVALWLMIPAMVFGCLAFLSIILDHYDRRANERRYQFFLKWTTRIGLALAACAYALDFLNL